MELLGGTEERSVSPTSYISPPASSQINDFDKMGTEKNQLVVKPEGYQGGYHSSIQGQSSDPQAKTIEVPAPMFSLGRVQDETHCNIDGNGHNASLFAEQSQEG